MKEIERQGHSLMSVDGQWIASNEIAVQYIIDNFDHVAYIKPIIIEKIKFAASKKASEIYSFIDPESQQAVGLYNFAEDLYLSTVASYRNPLSGRLLQFKAVYDITLSGIADVNNETDYDQCHVIYDLVINQIEAL